jgi:hypothetical protein
VEKRRNAERDYFMREMTNFIHAYENDMTENLNIIVKKSIVAPA